MLNRIMEADVTQRINAEPHERSDGRETYRNGYCDRQYNTRLGTLDLRIPTLREGTDFPPFPDARRLSEKALNAVIREAWINGVSTRKVDATGPADGDERYLPKLGVIPLPRHRRACAGVPAAAAGRGVALPVAECDLREGAQEREGGQRGGNNRLRGQPGRSPGDYRDGYR
ncbi:hypothetical protein KB20921_21370 [Edwardsiella ictaluri]|uniref:Mutator family transposase n=1 Tax=Edwardsiella ictaluri TaxID=67780 RepID=B2LSN6_EDWIC|nr:unknown [Edwardsiella ictaluri]STP81264.1 Transposase and inactivated derivatives [Edwardsiella ictaluri]BEH99386.1 hypothetical protein KH20906_21140 [Edwardsiella ictaluri]BEI02876.1 hypothetical protein KB20921_21370 [Edwardsiella ictaluri]BEI06337.1 hypothetical protein KH201010_21230 [Edwardsiella ictaluri]